MLIQKQYPFVETKRFDLDIILLNSELKLILERTNNGKLVVVEITLWWMAKKLNLAGTIITVVIQAIHRKLLCQGF